MARLPAITLLLALALAASAAPSLSTMTKKLARSGTFKAPSKMVKQEDPIPEKCSSLYVATLNCIAELDDDDDYHFDDDGGDDDYDFCSSNWYSLTNKTIYSSFISGGLYSKECCLTISDTYDCILNDGCQNTVNWASCPIDDCKYYGKNQTK